MANISTQKQSVFNPPRYAGSIRAEFDQLDYDVTQYSEFWRDAVSRKASEATSGHRRLGNSAKSQATNTTQPENPGTFKPVSRDCKTVQAVDESTGELITILESQADKSKLIVDPSVIKANRFRMQGIVSRLMPQTRMSKCLRIMQSGYSEVQVLKSKEFDSCSFSGLQTCGSVWSCPVCAAKISERRRLELDTAISKHKALGGSMLLVTLTVPHSKEDDLKDMLSRLSSAVADMKAHRNYKRIKVEARQTGTVRALEVTNGFNGWHPHIHELWFIDGPLSLVDLAILKTELFTVWSRSAINNEFDAPSEKFGVDVQNGDFAAAYVSKWGHEPTQQLWTVDAEMSKQTIKKAGRGGCSPFQLLEMFDAGDNKAGQLFIEYSRAFKGARQLVWSRGLKARFDIGEMTDEQLAAMQEANQNVVGSIDPITWNKLQKHDKANPWLLIRPTILNLACKDWLKVETFIAAVLSPPPFLSPQSATDLQPL